MAMRVQLHNCTTGCIGSTPVRYVRTERLCLEGSTDRTLRVHILRQRPPTCRCRRPRAPARPRTYSWARLKTSTRTYEHMNIRTRLAQPRPYGLEHDGTSPAFGNRVER